MSARQAERPPLAPELERVLALVEAVGEPPAKAGPRDARSKGSALETLCVRLGLSDFERDVLLMAVGIELDSRFHAACEARGGATFALALAAFPGGAWRALDPGSPLRRLRMIELGPAASLARSPLRVDEALVGRLLGDPRPDPRLQAVSQADEAEPLTPSQEEVAAAAAAAWGQAPSRGTVLQLVAREDGAPAAAVAQDACARRGLPVVVRISEATLAAAGVDVELVLRLCEREAAAAQGAVLLAGAEAPTEAGGRFLERIEAPVAVAGPTPRRLRGRPVLGFEVAKPTRAEQRALWREAGLPAAAAARCAASFNLGAAAVEEIASEAKALGRKDEPLAPRVWAAARKASRPKLDDLAQRVTVGAAWDDLVLPEGASRSLRLLVAHASAKARVTDDWGFGRQGARGLATTALFSGSSGTGKTTAAEVVARELDLDLYRIDLSATVSKYIGETEKNLRRLFDAAEAGGSVLLFDEADALFSKRTETRDSHDRNANLEVSYLLQRLETFQGVAILTTNMRQSIDPAFWRRFTFVVTFPFPDEAQREAIWRAVFPRQAPLRGLDYARLAQLTLSGGQVRAVALTAAAAAAYEDRPIAMADLLSAARLEYAKTDKSPTQVELRGWPA